MTTSTPIPGGDPVLPGHTRRSLLASPALLAPSLLAAPALAGTSTPILDLFREWNALQARWHALPLDTPRGMEDAAYAEERAIRDRIATEPATCLHDLAAKLVADTLYGDFAPEPGLIAECEAILAGALA